MNSGRIIFLISITVIVLCVDIYVYQAFRSAIKVSSPRKRKILLYGYIAVSIVTYLAKLLTLFFFFGKFTQNLITVWLFMLTICKMVAVPFLAIDDLRRLIIWLIRKFKKKKITELQQTETIAATQESDLNKISRSEFLSKAGIIAAAIPFASLGYGVIKGVYDYKVNHVKLKLPNLPKSFEGLKIAQISDIHSGSFYNKRAVQGGVDMLLAEKPDMVFFTGDLVNDETPEVKDYVDIFNKVKAPLGVYSTLGNHDYGDYKLWPSAKAKKQNLEDLKTVHRKSLGWDLLMNENRIIEQGGDKIAIVGIENWGKGRFPKYGRMDLAAKGTDEAAVKLLLSHDPSHWRLQVLPEYKDIDAMFSGHTHGMQFGIKLGDFQWSPIQYMYPEWSGLYQEQHQQLYVNVGYGFLGYPGRVGIAPEITIFELTRG
ncbi:metallophosphoesterase [Solitalea sp. MAHUQ-68]|uniref:Metallophosphoesterase n=1 Tax=Solitalea agri TaxID=2953739 RepID=A0A9X2F2G7_9SPHI|nr:metallophosphoesterase [Solitalea agri]MCO4293477.1 metallophosphoesterase [Solitalea agri]